MLSCFFADDVLIAWLLPLLLLHPKLFRDNFSRSMNKGKKDKRCQWKKVLTFKGRTKIQYIWSYTHFTEMHFHQKMVSVNVQGMLVHIPQKWHPIHIPQILKSSLFSIGRWGKLQVCKTCPHVPIKKCVIIFGNLEFRHNIWLSEILTKIQKALNILW